MRYYLILCRSVTYAQRARHALERAGISGTIARIPMEISENGCGYAVRVAERELAAAQRVISRAGIKAGKVVLQGEAAG